MSRMFGETAFAMLRRGYEAELRTLMTARLVYQGS